jgi:hypothetical protein
MRCAWRCYSSVKARERLAKSCVVSLRSPSTSTRQPDARANGPYGATVGGLDGAARAIGGLPP